MKALTIELPWGPSTNGFLSHFVPKGGNRSCTFISPKGREYFSAVGVLLIERRVPKLHGPLAMVIELHPPDRREIDVDNFNKAILDALKMRPKDKKQLPGAWVFAKDDKQVRDLRTIVRAPFPGGKAVVTLTPLAQATQVLFPDEVDDFPAIR